MNIAGMGVIGPRGRGIEAWERALEEGWVPPLDAAARGAPVGRCPVYAVPADAMADKGVLAKARRADRFTRMAVLAACDAWRDAGLEASIDKRRLGIVVATALGPHATTFAFLDGILDFGDAAVSPTAFSHSVHNAAASYIAMTLDVRGPTLTLTHFDFAFHHALLTARSWLDEGRCDAVLAGTVDELGATMEYVCGRLLRAAADGRIKPFAFAPAPEAVPGEGSVFFLLTKTPAGRSYACLAEVSQAAGLAADTGAVQVLDASGMANDERAYRGVLAPGAAVAGYAPLFGSLMTGSSFHAAAGALMLRRQKRYACPVQDNPHGIALCRVTEAAAVTEVFCTRVDCAGRAASIRLTGTEAGGRSDK